MNTVDTLDLNYIGRKSSIIIDQLSRSVPYE